jgi:hypothetical protein
MSDVPTDQAFLVNNERIENDAIKSPPLTKRHCKIIAWFIPTSVFIEPTIYDVS